MLTMYQKIDSIKRRKYEAMSGDAIITCVGYMWMSVLYGETFSIRWSRYEAMY